MKKILITIALVLLIGSLFLSTRLYIERVAGIPGRVCEYPNKTVQQVNWVWEWWPKRDEGKAFLPEGSYCDISYRPLDIAGVSIITSAGLIFFAIKRY